MPVPKRFVILGMILILTFICYSSVLRHQFLNWDDPKHLIENSAVQSFNINEIFTTTVSNVYVPLTLLSFAVEYFFFGLNPLVYHLNNLLLHLGVTALVFFLTRQLGFSVKTAGYTALIFGLHPIHVESVAWVTERKDVLYAFFYLLAVIYYERSTQKDHKGSYFLSNMFGVLSMLAKPMALSLPLVLLSVDWLQRRPFTKKIFLNKIPYVLLIIPIAWSTYERNTHTLSVAPDIASAALTFFWTFFFYVKQFFVPLNFSVVYQVPEPVTISNSAYMGPVFLFAGFVIIIFKFRDHKLFVWSWVYYVCSMFFLFRYNQISDLNFVADRFMYLPCLGFCVLAGKVIEKNYIHTDLKGTVPRRGLSPLTLILRRFRTFVLILLMTLLGVKTHQQTLAWKDSETFWTFVIQGNPKLALAYNNRGRALLGGSREGQALDDFSRAVKLDPEFEEAYNNRGNYYYQKQQYSLALRDFHAAVRINPYFKEGYNNIGNIYAVQKDFQSALEFYDQVIAIDSKDSDAYYNRATAYAFLGKYDEALEDYARAIQLNENYAAAYFNRSLIYKARQQFLFALREASTAKKKGFNVSESYMIELRNKVENKSGIHL